MTHQGGEPDLEDGNVNDCALHEVLRRDRDFSQTSMLRVALVVLPYGFVIAYSVKG